VRPRAIWSQCRYALAYLQPVPGDGRRHVLTYVGLAAGTVVVVLSLVSGLPGRITDALRGTFCPALGCADDRHPVTQEPPGRLPHRGGGTPGAAGHSRHETGRKQHRPAGPGKVRAEAGIVPTPGPSGSAADHGVQGGGSQDVGPAAGGGGGADASGGAAGQGGPGGSPSGSGQAGTGGSGEGGGGSTSGGQNGGTPGGGAGSGSSSGSTGSGGPGDGSTGDYAGSGTYTGPDPVPTAPDLSTLGDGTVDGSVAAGG
jgi:hypothetical protein